MTHETFIKKLDTLMYIEDYGMVDVILASIVANSAKFGDPVWLTLIGPSSGGKSQLIRPLAKANSKLIHRVDDLTPNTLLSGTMGMEHSLLGKIGNQGIISMDDLTVLFSKNVEARGEILSQFRMLYDGRFSKSSGNRKETLVWPADGTRGYIGMIAGSTPSIYRYFAEVADMGERFVSYRMKTYNKHKALEFVMDNQSSSNRMDDDMSLLMGDFMRGILAGDKSQYEHLSDYVMEQISNIAEHCTLLRTAVHIDERLGLVDEFPEPEMPLRVMKQLMYLAKGLQCVYQKPLTEENIGPLLWVGYSLANDKRRAYLKAIVGLELASKAITSRNVSAVTGLHSEVVKKGMDQLQALGVIRLLDETSGVKKWSLANRGLYRICMELDKPDLEEISDIEGDL